VADIIEYIVFHIEKFTVIPFSQLM